MIIGRSGYQNIDFSAFTGNATTIPGIYAKASSGLPLKISRFLNVGDLFTYGIKSGDDIIIPAIYPGESSLVISSITVKPDDTVKVIK